MHEAGLRSAVPHNRFRTISRASARFTGLMFAIMALGSALTRAQEGLEHRRHRLSTYTVTDLGTLLNPVAINDRSQVVGSYQVSAFAYHAFLWQHGHMTDLGTLGGDTSIASAINNKGMVVGQANLDSTTGHAFLWQDGLMTDLGTLGGWLSWAFAINDRGQVTGVSDTPGNTASHAFLWRRDQMIDLGTLGGTSSQAASINEEGDAAGFSTLLPFSSGEHGVLWREGRIIDLGTLSGGGYSTALGINDRGEIAGIANTSAGQTPHAVVWRNGRVIDLGFPPLAAQPGGGIRNIAINNDGQVILSSETNRGEGRGYLVHHKQMVDLNTLIPAESGWVITVALALNNRGQIVGIGTFNGEDHGLLLTPVDDQDDEIQH